MKRSICIIVMLWIAALFDAASRAQEVLLNFDKTQYSIENSEPGCKVISQDKEDSYDPGCPAIPLKNIWVATTVTGPYTISYQTGASSILSNNFECSITPLELPIELHNLTTIIDENLPIPPSNTFPEEHCKIAGVYDFNGFAIIHLRVSPFSYNPINKSLVWTPDMGIKISPAGGCIKKNEYVSKVDHDHKEFFRSLVINPEELDKVIYEANIISYNESCSAEYLIITSPELVEAFQPLANWKTSKGVPTDIITTDEIDRRYTEGDLSLKIKKYLYHSYLNGLIYALLGGDDLIIPPRRCYRNVGLSVEDNNLPADMFYSCFGGNFEWDANNNGIYGEGDDNIDITPNIYISRLPVRTPEHVDAYVSRLIAYESNPKVNNTLLMGGCKLFTKAPDGRCDAEVIGDSIFTSVIAPNWSGKRDKLYVSYEDRFADDFQHWIIQNRLEKGYSIINFDTHGLPKSWTTQSVAYSVSLASILKNKGHTLIVTSACYTNAFDDFDFEKGDSDDPSLSEAFIRNPDSGVIGYWGSSRQGWGKSAGDYMGPSHVFNKEFYGQLFGTALTNKNFGKVGAYTKIKVNMEYNDWTTVANFKWLLYTLNPIGDPEMPIYTSAPSYFNNISVSNQGSSLKISSHIPDTKMCLQGYENGRNTAYHIFPPASSFIINYAPEYLELTFSKQEHAVKKYSLYLLQNREIGSCTLSADKIMIGSDVNPTQQPGKVTIKGKVICNSEEIYLGPGTYLEKGSDITITSKE